MTAAAMPPFEGPPEWDLVECAFASDEIDEGKEVSVEDAPLLLATGSGVADAFCEVLESLDGASVVLTVPAVDVGADEAVGGAVELLNGDPKQDTSGPWLTTKESL